jgi:hypothetical protein
MLMALLITLLRVLRLALLHISLILTLFLRPCLNIVIKALLSYSISSEYC